VANRGVIKPTERLQRSPFKGITLIPGYASQRQACSGRTEMESTSCTQDTMASIESNSAKLKISPQRFLQTTVAKRSVLVDG
jgi:hypothetical protein